MSENVNIEHLLDVSLSEDPDSDDVWDACINFIRHLQWHKPRFTVLAPKIEVLPDDHRPKFECLCELANCSDWLEISQDTLSSLTTP